jgi:hypothetical protein
VPSLRGGAVGRRKPNEVTRLTAVRNSNDPDEPAP